MKIRILTHQVLILGITSIHSYRYNRDSGRFTVPPNRGGVYYFSFNVIGNEKYQVHLKMKKNGREDLCETLMFSIRDQDGMLDSGGCSVLVDLNPGKHKALFTLNNCKSEAECKSDISNNGEIIFCLMFTPSNNKR